jgi:hypothetical protein
MIILALPVHPTVGTLNLDYPDLSSRDLNPMVAFAYGDDLRLVAALTPTRVFIAE